MALEDRIENVYLHIWRGIVLFIATGALIVAVVASVAALNGLFAKEPYRPAPARLEERSEALKQELSIENFRNFEAGRSEQVTEKEKGPNPDRGFANLMNETLHRTAANLEKYTQSAFPGRPMNREALRASMKNLMKEFALTDEARAKLYLSTLERLTEDLARLGVVQGMLPEDKRITAERLLRWHAETVQRSAESVDRENEKQWQAYQQQLTDYAHSRARILGYVVVGAGAFLVFVFTVFLFVIIRIERDLKTMAVASVLTSKQLQSSG